MQFPPLSPEDPTSPGDFDLLGRIGQGGMGQVFLGESPTGEPAAVKVIKPTVVDTPEPRPLSHTARAPSPGPAGSD